MKQINSAGSVLSAGVKGPVFDERDIGPLLSVDSEKKEGYV